MYLILRLTGRLFEQSTLLRGIVQYDKRRNRTSLPLSA